MVSFLNPPKIKRTAILFSIFLFAYSEGCEYSHQKKSKANEKKSPFAAELLIKNPKVLSAISKNHPFFLYEDEKQTIRASTPMFASLDQSPQWLGVDQNFRESAGVTGKGVIVGVIDTGIDWTREDFYETSNGSRILYILDYMLPALQPDNHPEIEHGIYRIYGKNEVDDAIEAIRTGKEPPVIIESTDVVGHGTHVASIIAGKDPDGKYTGIAPDAWLVIVKAIRREGTRFEDYDVMQGMDFVFSVCDFYNMPCVVNLSLGGQMGGHDGTSEIERKIADKIKEKPEGRVVVASGGNRGGKKIHAMLDLRKGEEKSLKLFVPSNSPRISGGVSRIVLDIWMRNKKGSNDSTISIECPDGSVLSARAGNTVEEIISGTWVTISNSPSGQDPWNGDWEAILSLTGDPDSSGGIAPGYYKIKARGEGAVDIYLAQIDAKTGPIGGVYLEGENVVEEGTVDLPATGKEVIAAGSITARTKWVKDDGTLYEAGGSSEIGFPSGFNSRGPSRSGAIKPEILAPGEWIVAALSKSTDLQLEDSILSGADLNSMTIQNGKYVFSRGTSSSAAMISGLSALLLEISPELSAEEIKSALIFSSLNFNNNINNSDTTNSSVLSFGIPNAKKAIRIARGERDATVQVEKTIVVTNLSIYSPEFSPDVEVYVFPAGENSMPVASPVNIKITPTHCSMKGEVEPVGKGVIYLQKWSCSESEEEIPPHGERVYFIVTIDGMEIPMKGSVTISRERIFKPDTYYVSRGSCSITGFVF